MPINATYDPVVSHFAFPPGPPTCPWNPPDRVLRTLVETRFLLLFLISLADELASPVEAAGVGVEYELDQGVRRPQYRPVQWHSQNRISRYNQLHD
jgi:hypothetical protein